MRRLESYKSLGVQNSLWYWSKIKSPLRVTFNYLIMKLCRIIPSLRLKNALYRLMGVKVGEHVSVGLEATFDIFFPELIEIGDNTIIGYNTTILAHEFLIDEYRTGRVKIGKDVVIGANCSILPGVNIADNTVVSACSLVNRDAEGFVGGVPTKNLRKVHENH